MTALHERDFPAFMEQVTGFQPFPWQERLLARILRPKSNDNDDDAGWPDLLELPTGSGKTSALLIALFALALAPQRMPRRIVLVVDRRIIVDQVHRFCLDIQRTLENGEGVAGRVAHRLTQLTVGPEAKPLHVAQLRGGVARDDGWLTAPDQPAVLASTVDQVGSRLLFRGYGVSDSMRPIHAGVLAHDTLYFLDEVHLATAFAQTLTALRDFVASPRWRDVAAIDKPLQFVRMSATPPGAEDGATPLQPFGLEADDRAHPVLGPRLTASRPAEIVLVKTKRETDPSSKIANTLKLAKAAATRVSQAIESGAGVVGVVVNRVATAREIARLVADADSADVQLITGRMRPFDRARVQSAVEAVAKSDPNRTVSEAQRPTVVVATSCIEAGADFDFDALVTEVASLSALRQRFGRLNRLGLRKPARAWILGSSHQLGKSAKPDPIYGDALAGTWAYLDSVASEGAVDFGISQMEELAVSSERAADPSLEVASSDAPVLFPSYLDMLAETRPAPHPDPEVALWLHGMDRDPDRDVSVIFRGDIEDTYGPQGSVGNARPEVEEALEFLPPLAEEALPVPLRALQPWLDSRLAAGERCRVWRWTADGSAAVQTRELRVGDTVVVPSSIGGLRMGTWDPGATVGIDDIAELVHFERSDRGASPTLRLRIDPRTLPPTEKAPPLQPTGDAAAEPETWREAEDAVRAWLREQAAPGSRDAHAYAADWDTLLEHAASLPAKVTPAPGRDGLEIRRGPRGTWRIVTRNAGAAFASTEDETSSFVGTPTSLDTHLRDVEAWAGALADASGLDERLAGDIALAGLLHDIGKADSRFQVMLHGGDPIAAAGGNLLAKSHLHSSAASRRGAQRRARWPGGFRHELISLVMLDASPELQDKASDIELVRHLVASHHGWCRPWIPDRVDDAPQEVAFEIGSVRYEASTAAIDSQLAGDCATRFRQLCRRYGWYGLAYLEATLRLADHRASRTPDDRPRRQR